MVMVSATITDALNWFNAFGGFSYLIPFLLIFAVVFALLDRSKVLGDNKPLMGIIAAALGLLSLQYDFVPEFFAVIFPRFGVGLSVFLVALIFIGFFWPEREDKKGLDHGKWIGYVVAIGVIIWAFSSWDEWGYYYGFGGWFAEYIWALIVLGAVIGVIIWAIKWKPKKE
jgi:hypothetical protein